MSRLHSDSPLSVLVVVLSWNNPDDTLACLESLAHLTYPNRRTLVVDNGSQDDSVGQIRRRFPDLEILPLDRNLGYAGGNNRGVRYALDNGFDYVWLVNDDALVASDSLEILMNVAEASPQAGFLGPMVCMKEEPQQILSAGGLLTADFHAQFRGVGQLDVGQFAAVSKVDYLSGCALLANCDAVKQIGLLDESFFAYHEDVEWCYRAPKAGFGALFVPGAKVWHPDTRHRDADRPVVTYYIARNHLRFLAKHRLGRGAILKEMAAYLLRIVVWTVRPKWRHKRRQRQALVRALADFVQGRSGRVEGLD